MSSDFRDPPPLVLVNECYMPHINHLPQCHWPTVAFCFPFTVRPAAPCGEAPTISLQQNWWAGAGWVARQEWQAAARRG